MKLRPTSILAITIPALLWLTFACSSVRSLHPAAAPTPYVILKLDDAWFENDLVHPGWTQVLDYLNAKNIVATIGIVGERMQDGSPDYYAWLQAQDARGHEVWNHGWCHCKPVVEGQEVREFLGTSYTHQLRSLQKTQALLLDKTGLRMTTFGAPYNAVDTNTARALAELPELTEWLYAPNNIVTTKARYPRIPALNLEQPVHVPNPDSLIAAWEQYQHEPLIVLQGHPRSWVADASRMEDFKRIIQFLEAKKVRFITPRQYRELMR
ncbi:polysaccharide deacetylase family protein [Neolewinella persica]|uniref:polysaccharide deacetylase family protein n=1 Tax=Neolewinella persica TaxID=70998 RepID=UPI0005C74C45|nr:polysaccharide deacetylase family protein [Neolewinella persica]